MYNGYKFCEIAINNPSMHVYNPYLINYVLDEKKFGNYWFNSESSSFLINLIKERNYSLVDVEKTKIT